MSQPTLKDTESLEREKLFLEREKLSRDESNFCASEAHAPT